MGKLIIDRESNYCACAAKYNVFLDNIVIDHINNGKIHEYIIPNGKHSLYLQNGFINFGTKSNILNFFLSDNDIIRVSCKSGFYNSSGILLKFDMNNNDIISNWSECVSNYDDLCDKYRVIDNLFRLKEDGSITKEEFENEKRKILGGKL